MPEERVLPRFSACFPEKDFRDPIHMSEVTHDLKYLQAELYDKPFRECSGHKRAALKEQPSRWNKRQIWWKKGKTVLPWR